MSERTHPLGQQAPAWSGWLKTELFWSNAPYIALYAIAIVLIAISNHDPASAKGVWHWFIPVVGLVSTAAAWHEYAGPDWQSRGLYLLRQALHWGALLLVIWLLFNRELQHLLNAETDGLVLIYLLGLTSLLGGIHLDWRLAPFGLFLILSAILIAFLQDNALLIAVISLAAVIAAVIGAWIWMHLRPRVAVR